MYPLYNLKPLLPISICCNRCQDLYELNLKMPITEFVKLVVAITLLYTFKDLTKTSKVAQLFKPANLTIFEW